MRPAAQRHSRFCPRPAFGWEVAETNGAPVAATPERIWTIPASASTRGCRHRPEMAASREGSCLCVGNERSASFGTKGVIRVGAHAGQGGSKSALRHARLFGTIRSCPVRRMSDAVASCLISSVRRVALSAVASFSSVRIVPAGQSVSGRTVDSRNRSESAHCGNALVSAGNS